MNTHNEQAWQKASSLRGCLAHLHQTTGRRRHHKSEDPLAVDDPFVADEAKILSSKTFRLLAQKTQVLTQPKSPLVRTRQSHVLEVVATSVITSEMLGLNTNLVRAAALGHDVGHVPFGHQGEAWMAHAMGRSEFCHEKMGPIITQRVERSGQGLNLTFETLDAMMRHSGDLARQGMTQEAWVLRYTDKFTYIFHDINDIVGRMKYPVPHELIEVANWFGANQRQRTSTAIAHLVIESHEMGKVSFEQSEAAQKFRRLRELMYEVYPHVTQQNVARSMEQILEFLTLLRIADPFFLLAIMTDKDAIFLANQTMKDIDAFNQTSVSEIVPHLHKIGTIDLCDPGLDW